MGRLKRTKDRRVTIKDIAALANVSIGTVDRVLHNRGEVNQETYERVMSFVDELGYTPNLLAKSLALKKGFTISVLIPDAGNNNHYWKKPLEGFNNASEELNDFNTKIEISNYDPGVEQSFIRRFEDILTKQPSGIILAPSFHDAAQHLTLKCQSSGIPYMFIDNNLEGQGLAYFGQDAHQSGIVAAKLMHNGLPDEATILILNLARNKAITHHMQRREKGFVEYFKNLTGGHGITTRSVAVDLSSEDEPGAILSILLKQHTDTAGIFVTNSKVYKVAEYLSKAGKDDITVAGYDLIGDNVEFLKSGIIDFLICQKPEDQGYKSAMAMFNYLLTGRLVNKINYSPIDIIVKENLDYYKQ